jgi:hypothetical protein
MSDPKPKNLKRRTDKIKSIRQEAIKKESRPTDKHAGIIEC